jgi:hypothetical protein
MARQKKCNRAKCCKCRANRKHFPYYDITISLTVCYDRRNFRKIMVHGGRRCKVVQTIVRQLNEIQRNTLNSNRLSESFDA